MAVPQTNPNISLRSTGKNTDEIMKAFEMFTKVSEKMTNANKEYSKAFNEAQKKLGDNHEELQKLQEKHEKEKSALEKKFSGRTNMVGAVGNTLKLGMKGLLSGIPAGQMMMLGQQLFDEVYPKADRQANKLERQQKKLDAKQKKELLILQKTELSIKKKQVMDNMAEQRSKMASARNQQMTKGDEMIIETLKGDVSEPLKKIESDDSEMLSAQQKELEAINLQEANMKKDEKDAKKEKKGGFLKAVKEKGKDLMSGLLPLLLLILPSLIMLIVSKISKLFGKETPEEAKARQDTIISMEERDRKEKGLAPLNDEQKQNLRDDKNVEGEKRNWMDKSYTNQNAKNISKVNSELADLKEPQLTKAEESDVGLGSTGKQVKARRDMNKAVGGFIEGIFGKKKEDKQDVIITKSGKIIETSPDDNIMATKNNMIGDSNPAMRREKEKQKADDMKQAKSTNELTTAINKQTTNTEKNTTSTKAEYRIRDYSPVSEALKYIYITGN